MDMTAILALASPVTWLIAIAVVISLGRLRDRILRTPGKPSRRRRMGATTAAAGAAFQFFAIAYRPNHAFTAKAQIQQQEDADEDDNGTPETPLKHLHRQLRRIRHGEPVERLIWRLE